MLGSKPAHLQPSDALGVELVELLSEQPARVQPPQRERALDEPEQRLAAHAPHRPLALRAEHAHVTRLLGVVADEDQRDRAAALAALPGGAQARLLDARRVRVLDPVNENARQDLSAAPAISRLGRTPGAARISRSWQRGQAVEQLGGVHSAQRGTQGTGRA